MQSLGDRIGVRIQVARGVAQQQRRKRRIVIDDDAAFAIKNFAARRENRDIAHPILLGQQRIFVAVHHLEPPQSVSQ